MFIRIEVEKLMKAIQRFNPDADLTGLKAYLFDYLFPPVEDAKRPLLPSLNNLSKMPESSDGDVGAKDDMESDYASENMRLIKQEAALKAQSFEDEEEEDGETYKPTVYQPKKMTPMDKKQARDRRRAETADLSNMNSKQLMEHLTGNMVAKKKQGTNQFVDIGEKSGAGGDDIEIG